MTKEQHRALAASYKAYHDQTAATYLKVFEDDPELPESLKQAKRNDVAAAKAAYEAAMELAK